MANGSDGQPSDNPTRFGDLRSHSGLVALDPLPTQPLAAIAGHVFHLLTDEELHEIIRRMPKRGRQVVLRKLKQPSDRMPSVRKIGQFRRAFATAPNAEVVLSELAHQPMLAVRRVLDESGADTDLEAKVQRLNQLADEVGDALVLAGLLPLAVANEVDDGEDLLRAVLETRGPAGADHEFGIDWDVLREAVDELDEVIANDAADIAVLVRSRESGLLPAAEDAQLEDMLLIEWSGDMMVELASVLREISERVGGEAIPSRLTTAEVRRIINNLEKSWQDHFAPTPLFLHLVGTERFEEPVRDLVEAAGSDDDMKTIAEAVVDLVLCQDNDREFDQQSAHLDALLDGILASDPAPPGLRSLSNAVLRGQIKLQQPSDSDTEPQPSDDEAEESHAVDDRPHEPTKIRDGNSQSGQSMGIGGATKAPVDGGPFAREDTDGHGSAKPREARPFVLPDDAGGETPKAPSRSRSIAPATESKPTPKVDPDEEVISELTMPVEVPEAERGDTTDADVEVSVPASDDRIANVRFDTDELAPPALESSTGDLDLTGIETEALIRNRPVLAYWAAELADEPVRAAALAALALAGEVRSGSGKMMGALVEQVNLLSGHIGVFEPTTHLALAATLRGALFGSPLLFNPLLELPTAYAHHKPTTDLIAAVGVCVRQGVAIARNVRTGEDGPEEQIRRLIEEARTELEEAPKRTVRYHAATRVWQRWLRPNGLLGGLLTTVIADDRGRAPALKDEVTRLRRPGVWDQEIANADTRVQRGSPIEAGARTTLMNKGEQMLGLVSAWIEEIDALAHREEADSQQQNAVHDVERAAKNLAVDELFHHTHDDPLDAALTDAAERSIRATLRILTSEPLEAGEEADPATFLTDDLLLSGSPPIRDGRAEPTSDDLLVSLDADKSDPNTYLDAYERRASIGDHEATARIVTLATALDESIGQDLADKRMRGLEEYRHRIRRERDDVLRLLATARVHGHLDETEGSELNHEVETLDPTGREDLDLLAGRLEAARQRLAALKKRAQRDIENWLDNPPPDINEGALGRIRDRIDNGDLATAEEYRALLLDDQDLPEPMGSSTVFSDFWPEQAKRLESVNVDRKLIDAARNGRKVDGLDYGDLEFELREETASGLEAWAALREGRPKGRLIDAIRPVLRLLSIQAHDARHVEGIRLSSGIIRQLTDYRPVGRALIPDFGSQNSSSRDTTNLLLVIADGAVQVKDLITDIRKDPSARPVMVWYPGVLDERQRHEFSRAFREAKSRRPVLLIDDLIVTHISTIRDRDYETLMRLTLPFTASNPYQSVGGRTPVEMFYGRHLERRSLADPGGSALVYGGRQLGKSSLLRATQRDFDNGKDRRAIYLDLKVEQIGTNRGATEIFDVLWSALVERGVFTEPPPEARIRQRFEAAVKTWLRAVEGRALLFLLDEVDMFLDADAEHRFATVDSLKGLMMETGGRIKFVFAGLHKVTRFKSVENQPFAHLGDSEPVGPLHTSDALALVTRPVNALGYRYEDAELPARILAFCNNNPSLLVLFMHALINRMLDQPLQAHRGQPPVQITHEDLENTYGQENVAERIRGRFELTLDLDPAYKVIAYVVAHETRTEGVASFTFRQLRSAVTNWWEVGLEGVSSDEFRALCEELVDLGVLSMRGGLLSLRSPNILRFLGSTEHIEEVLLEASELLPSQTFKETSARSRLSPTDERRSPLSAAQTMELLKPRNQVRIVVGSTAMGVDRVGEALKTAASEDVMVEFRNAKTMQPKRYENTTGGHRVIVIDLEGASVEQIEKLIADGLSRGLDKRDVKTGTLGFVLVAGSDRQDVWRAVIRGGEPWARLGAVILRPVDQAAWRHWIYDSELPISSHDASDEILETSGGWLELLEKAARIMKENGDQGETRALDFLRASFDDPDEARDLARRAGLDDHSAAVLRQIEAHCEGSDRREDFEIAASFADGDVIDVRALEYAGIIREIDEHHVTLDRRVLAALATEPA